MSAKGAKNTGELKKLEKNLVQAMKAKIEKKKLKRMKQSGLKVKGNIGNSFKKMPMNQVSAGTGFKSHRQSTGKLFKHTDVDFGEVDYGPVSVTTSMSEGSVVTNCSGYVSPTSTLGSRMAIFASLYEQWQCELFELVFYPSVISSDRVQLILFIDPDADDPMDGGSELAARARQSEYSEVLNCSTLQKEATICFHRLAGSTQLFTDIHNSDDPHWNSAGRWAILCGNTPSVTATVGRIAVRYRYRYWNPTLEDTSFSVASTTLAVTAGMSTTKFLGTAQTFYSNGCTVSVNSLGTIMTFAGGTGYYVLALNITGTGLDFGADNSVNLVSSSTNMTVNSDATYATNNAALSTCTGVILFQITTNPATITFGNLSAFTSMTFSRIVIARIFTISQMEKSMKKIMREKILKADNFVTLLDQLEKPVAKDVSKRMDLLEAENKRLHSKLEGLTPSWKLDQDSKRDSLTEPSKEESLETAKTRSLVLDKCVFCGMDPPDHIGRNCPQRVRPVIQPENCKFCGIQMLNPTVHYVSCRELERLIAQNKE
jgi:hypothetical protein